MSDKPTFPGHDYGLKVIDPVDGKEIFNAKYPIFGSDITNKIPQITTERIIVTNSKGFFNEPATPSISWIADNNWHTMQYNQIPSNYRIATIPHGQGRRPIFMSVGRAHIKHTMRVRYYQASWGGPASYNNVYLPNPPASGYWEYDYPLSLGGSTALAPYVSGVGSYFQFNNVGPYTSPIYSSEGSNSIYAWADETNIYIDLNLQQTLNHQRYNSGSFGWDRYEKYWGDFTGSWYQFTFYILPYNRENDIFIR